MFAVVKNLVSNRFRKVECSKLYEVDLKKNVYHPFQPTSRNSFESKRHYGEIIKSDMVMNYIVALRETETEVDEILDDPRAHGIRNPKRISIESAIVPLSKLKLNVEMGECSSMQKSKDSAVKKTNMLMSKKILTNFKQGNDKSQETDKKKSSNDFKNKHQQGSSSGHSNSKKRHSLSPVTVEEKKLKLGQEMYFDIRDKLKPKDYCGSKTVQGIHSDIENTFTIRPSCSSKVGESSNQVFEYPKSDIDEISKEDGLSKKSVSSTSHMQLEIDNLKDKLGFSVASYNSLEKQYNTVQQELELAVSKISSLEMEKEAICKQLLDLQEKDRKNTGVKGGCALSAMTTAVEGCDLAPGISKDSIDCGLGIIINKEDIATLELKEKFSNRVRGLAILFWNDKLHTMSVSASKEDKNRTVISEKHIVAMKNILNTMPWDMNEVKTAFKVAFPKKTWDLEKVDKSYPITVAMVKRQLSRVTSSAVEAAEKKSKLEGGKVQNKESSKGGNVKASQKKNKSEEKTEVGKAKVSQSLPLPDNDEDSDDTSVTYEIQNIMVASPKETYGEEEDLELDESDTSFALESPQKTQ